MAPPRSVPPPSARDVRAAELFAPARLRSPETGAVGRPRLPLEVSRSEAVATLRSGGLSESGAEMARDYEMAAEESALSGGSVTAQCHITTSPGWSPALL